MALYSLFLIRRGELIGNRACNCGDDMEALDKAYELCADQAVEVWQADRLVARVKEGAKPPTADDSHSG